jgi:TonB family protein
MKREFATSIIIHLGIVFGLFFFTPPSHTKLEGYPLVYRVGLVSFPSGGKISVGSSSGGESSKPSAQKGVAIKEFRKGKTKSTNRKKKEEKTTTPSKQKDTTKVTKKDQEAAEYGLGDGISSAQVDAHDFGSPYYLSLIFGKIRDIWENPVQASSTLMTTIYFKILRDGSIMEAKVEKTSGIDLFDQSAVRAIVSSAPFPPLPNEFTGEYLGIHLEFEYIQ